MFSKVLIANRGEVAIRIHATLEKLGIQSAGVFAPADREALHVARISECYLLEDTEQTGYLDIKQVIAAALTSGAQAIHPGYGFLAENANFARACKEAGLVFIGPPASAMVAMGEKISAREYARSAGVPVVPGVGAPGMSNEALLDACKDLIFPLLIKPAAGGGGKGLHVAQDRDQLRRGIEVARREAKKAFGDESLLIEKYLSHARHIEFQVAADAYGNVMHLGERECSLQRRHQKVIEEAPAPGLTPKNREIMGEAAIALTSAIGYQNLGTIEFLVDADSPDVFFFMEMNTRLQVEHRVTEMITGLDFVECQLRLANGDNLKDVIPQKKMTGHAIEARVYAEDAYNDFLPTGGVIGKYVAPDTSSTIVDSAITDGTVVSSSFDPMFAKISCWGEDRPAALVNLRKALSKTVLLGITTNLDFLGDLLGRDEIQTSEYDTKFLESREFKRAEPPTQVLAAYAAVATTQSKNPSWRSDGWRLSGSPISTVAAYVDGTRYEIPTESKSELSVEIFHDGSDVWLHHESFGTWLIKTSNDRPAFKDKVNEEIVSPMPGVVIAVNVSNGEKVKIGDALVIIEAMKMEHIVRARRAGRIVECNVTNGVKVRVGQVLLEVVDDV